MTAGRINQVHDAFRESCHDSTRREAAMEENIYQEIFLKCKQNSQIRSMCNSMPMTAERTSSEQHFTMRMLRQMEQTFFGYNPVEAHDASKNNRRIKQNNTPEELSG